MQHMAAEAAAPVFMQNAGTGHQMVRRAVLDAKHRGADDAGAVQEREAPALGILLECGRDLLPDVFHERALQIAPAGVHAEGAGSHFLDNILLLRRRVAQLVGGRNFASRRRYLREVPREA